MTPDYQSQTLSLMLPEHSIKNAKTMADKLVTLKWQYGFRIIQTRFMSWLYHALDGLDTFL